MNETDKKHRETNIVHFDKLDRVLYNFECYDSAVTRRKSIFDSRQVGQQSDYKKLLIFKKEKINVIF